MSELALEVRDFFRTKHYDFKKAILDSVAVLEGGYQLVDLEIDQQWGELKALLNKHRHHIERALMVSLAMNGIGMALLYVFIHQLAVPPRFSSIATSPIMWIVSFFPNWLFVWRDRRTDALPGASKWGLQSAVFMGLSQSMFYVMTGPLDIAWWLTRGVQIVTLGPLSFIVANLFVFPTVVHTARKVPFRLPFRTVAQED